MITADALALLLLQITVILAVAKLTDAVNTLRTRVDELQKRMRGLDELEERIAKLEHRVDELSTAKPAPRRRTTRAASPKRANPKERKTTSSEG